MYEIKVWDAYEDCQGKKKIYDNLNKLVLGKMTDEKPGVSIKLFGGLKSKIYPYLVNDGNKHKKAKGMNGDFVEKVTHNKYI